MSEEVSETGDLVEREIRQVRRRLEGMRARGELPEFPPGELESQFRGVVESVEAGLLAEAPIDMTDLRRSGGLPPGPPSPPSGSRVRRYTRRGVDAVRRRVGSNSVNATGFALAAGPVLEAVIDRQQRLQNLVLQVQLDRIRDLEYRISVLELELERQSSGESQKPIDA